MRKQYSPFFQAEVNYRLVILLLLFCLGIHKVRAQEGTQGNIYITNEFQMTFFGQHSFVAGGSGSQPGIIYTNRNTPNASLNYSPSATYVGANDANHVNGYVRKIGNANFTFPIGDGTTLRSASISNISGSAPSFTAAYFSGDPQKASPLVGGPFVLFEDLDGYNPISDKEYWVIKGDSKANISLTYNEASDAYLLDFSIQEVSIAGYHVINQRWERLSSLSIPDFSGSPGSNKKGTLVTLAQVRPDDYAAFTFCSNMKIQFAHGIFNIPDFQPTITMDDKSFNPSVASRPFRVTITNIQEKSKSNSMQVRIYKPTPQSTIVVDFSNTTWSNIKSESNDLFYTISGNVELNEFDQTYIDCELVIPLLEGVGNFNLRAFIPKNTDTESLNDNHNNNAEVRITKSY